MIDQSYYIHSIFSQKENFFGSTNPIALANKYGTPLYVYSEEILRKRCRELKHLLRYPCFSVNYSAKANTNIHLLKIIHEEDFSVDAMSPGEIFLELEAGFDPKDILFISNNVSEEEFRFAVERGVLVSIDSFSQLEKFGKLFPQHEIAIRINPGVGAGHHEKVITGGKKTKFGINAESKNEIKEILAAYHLKLVGLNQHIGSLFMTPEIYLEAVSFLLSFSEEFENIRFLDFGGGFGIPYHKEDEEKRLDLKNFGEKFDVLLEKWVKKNQREIAVKIEPGRYVVAECGILLGKVNTIKENSGIKYVGTDLGFNVLMRPILYDSYHDVEIYSETLRETQEKEKVTIVGNICETGDILAKDRFLPKVFENDILGILDVGAYGMSMSSNYNSRLRPAEVLITALGEPRLIRRRDTFRDFLR